LDRVIYGSSCKLEPARGSENRREKKQKTPTAPLSRGEERFLADREEPESKYELAQREMIVLSYL
jgi:hypothetical protein